MDFDFTTETITPGNTNVLTIGGTGGLEIPAGISSQRPGSPANGLIRYNSESGTIECFVANTWASSLASVANQVIVQKTPGAGQFASIADACASITTASSSNPWEVLICPGVYEEPEIIIPAYVQVTGIEEYSVIVKPITDSQDLFIMDSGTSINFLQIYDVGPGKTAITARDISGAFALCHKVAMINCDIGWTIDSTTVDTIVYLEYCDAQGGTTGVDVSSSGTASTYVNLENFYIYGTDTSNPTHGISVTGGNTEVNVQAFGIEGVDGTGTGIYVQDGAYLAAKAGHVFGWNIGANIADVGSAASLEFLGCAFHLNTTWDFLSEHIDATGTLSGTARNAKINATVSPDFTFAFSDPEANSFVQTGSFFMGPNDASLTDVSNLIIDTPVVGLLTGGVMSIGGLLTLNVSSGTGYLRKSGLMTRIDWSSSSMTLTPGTTPYIYIDQNGIKQQAPTLPNSLTNIILGRVGVNGTQIYTLGNLSINISNYGNKVEDYLRDTVGPVFVSGSVVLENVATPRAIDVTSGHWYYGTQQRFPSSKTAPNIVIAYHVGGVITFSLSAQVPTGFYDDGTNLVPMTSGYYAKHVIYQASEGIFQTYTMAYADNEYATLNEVRDAPLPLPPIDPGPTPKIAAIIVQEGNNNIVEVLDIRPLFFGSSGGSGTSGTTIHGNLLGLAANDHPQYLLIDGTSTMSGDLDMGNFDVIDVSSVNGVIVETHASRHLPNGDDALITASAVGLNLSSTNTVGINNSLARSDHTHQITGVQPLDATLTSLSSYNTNGLLTQTAPDTFTGRVVAGTSSRVSVSNGNGVSGNPTIDIDAAYAGQTSITTLGTITTGVWSGSAILTSGGGTGLTTIGTPNQILGTNAGATGLEYKTISAGTAINVSNAVNSITIANTGVTSNVAGNGISVSAATGAVTISNTGVTGLVAGTNISVSGATGSVTVSVTGTVPNATNAANATNSTITDDTTTDATVFPTWVTATTGNLPERVSSTKLTFNPSTGILSATQFAGSGSGLTNIPNSALSNSSITVTAGTGIGVTGSPVSLGGAVTISNTGVTSVALSLPSIITVAGSPVTTTGTLTGTLATQSANTVFAGPTSAGPTSPTFRTLGLATNDISDVIITAPTANQVLTYNGTDWINSVGNQVLQVITGAIPATSGTTQTVLDNTVPTNTEGFQIWTQTFTPLRSTSRIIITFSVTLSHATVGRTFITSIFAGATNIGSVMGSIGATSALNTPTAAICSPVCVVYSPGSIATITFSARTGTNGSGTAFVNQTTAATLGAAPVTEFVIMEVA